MRRPLQQRSNHEEDPRPFERLERVQDGERLNGGLVVGDGFRDALQHGALRLGGFGPVPLRAAARVTGSGVSAFVAPAVYASNPRAGGGAAGAPLLIRVESSGPNRAHGTSAARARAPPPDRSPARSR